MPVRIKTRDGKREVVKANFASGGLSRGTNAAGTSQSTSYLLGADLKSGLLEGIIDEKTPQQLQAVYRDIYLHDPVAGAAVDLKATLPWSDFTLTGAEDAQLAVFHENLERLNMNALHPELSTDQMVSGAFVASLAYDAKLKGFSDIIPYNYADCEVQPVPLYSVDPIIRLNVSKELKAFANDRSDEAKRIQARVPASILQHFRTSGKVDLDPVSTLYVPRATLSTLQIGVSYYRRVLPIYLLERILYRGTISEATRRQRSTLHIQAGDDDWLPTEDDLNTLVGLFQSTELDPISAVVATRHNVTTSEIRSAGDFWKWTDVADQLANMKMQALGINETFLSGDASYNCVAGDTLIPTEHGIMRIDEIADRANGKLQAIDLRVGSRERAGRARAWLYNGKAPTIIVKTHTGNDVQGTPKHPMLVLRGGDLKWVNLKDVRIGDLMCVNPTSVTRSKSLRLDLVEPMRVVNDHSTKSVRKPEHMTPELGFVLGALAAEGHITTDGRSVRFANSNQVYRDAYANKLRAVFGNVTITENVVARAGQTGVVHDGTARSYARNHDCVSLVVSSRELVSYLDQLGMPVLRRKHGRTQSYQKQVPWSVLQADRDTQAAFLAAHLEGDGCIVPKSGEIRFCSYSVTMLKQIQAMLNAFGIICKRQQGGVILNGVDAQALWRIVKPYMIHKTLDENRVFEDRRTYGVPNDFIHELMTTRLVRRSTRGNVYRDDAGREVVVGFNRHATLLKNRFFLYDKYNRGAYDDLLADLKRVSKSVTAKLVKLLELGYHYAEVTSVRKGKVTDVYDLSMNSPMAALVAGKDTYREPAFIVNGLVGRNTMETALSVFIEELRTYRSRTTHQIYSGKIFPLIASLNDFRTKEPVRRVRETSYLQDVTYRLNDTGTLVIPEMHWHKQLRPEADNDYMGILETLSDKGVPIPLRMWAAAGGLNIDKLLADLDDDRKVRDDIAKRKRDAASEDEEAALRLLETATASNPAARLLARDFGESAEIYTRTVTGKRRHVINQTEANRKANETIAKSLRSLSDPNNFLNAYRRQSRG